ncbi:MAG: hypothetical protein G3W69_31080, partial [Xanthomonas perforans]|nr:hypothetical protein [Xanthomonas perforans]
VARLAGNAVKTFCLTCKFDHFNPGATGSSLVAFRGNAVTLNDLFSTFYAANPINITANDFDQVDEKVWAIYGQLTWKGEIAGRAAGLVFGAR